MLFPSDLGESIPENDTVRVVSRIVDGLNVDSLIGTSGQFITNYAFYWNPGTTTMLDFLSRHEQAYGAFPKKAVADSGYGSEENYEFMEANDVEAFVEYPLFHNEQHCPFLQDIFRPENLHYNEAVRRVRIYTTSPQKIRVCQNVTFDTPSQKVSLRFMWYTFQLLFTFGVLVRLSMKTTSVTPNCLRSSV